ncbi:LysR family transcriptional regulator [Pseudonocardia nematodicida]|uniref:LysR family transcriptional regulator n=1 Tax=Pseudonocardia nematodicida TaxID=1206997 RepID=A0ABV1KBG9_9PSEU
MELRQLRYFAGVAIARNFSRAAEDLHVAQPALSRQVRALEVELGADLLVRTPRGVELTEAGRRLLGAVEQILGLVDGLGALVAETARSPSGRVVVGMSPSLVPVLADEMTKSVHSRYPEVEVELVEGLSMFLSEWVVRGRLDVAVFTDVGPMPRLDRTVVGEDEVVLVGAAETITGTGPLADGQGLTAAAGSPLVVTPGFWKMITDRLGGIDVVADHQIDSIVAVKKMVLRGECCSVMPSSFVHDEVGDESLRTRAFTPSIRRQIVAVTRTGRAWRPATEVVVAMTSAVLAEIRTPEPGGGGTS